MLTNKFTLHEGKACKEDMMLSIHYKYLWILGEFQIQDVHNISAIILIKIPALKEN